MAFRLDNSSKWLTRSTNLPSPTNFSICGWSNLRASVPLGMLGTLWEPNTPLYVQIGTDSSGTGICVTTEYGGNTIFPTIGTPGLNNWFFWGLTCSGSGLNQVTGYYGSANDQGLVSSTAHLGNVFTPTLLEFGNDYLYNEYVTADMGAIYVYDGVLTFDEMVRQKIGMLPVRTDILNGWYPANNLLETDAAKDSSGLGRDLTLNGSISMVDGPPVSWSGLPIMFMSELPSRVGVATPSVPNITSSATGTTSVTGTATPSIPNITVSSTAIHPVVGELTKSIGDFSLLTEGYDPNTITRTRATTGTVSATSTSSTQVSFLPSFQPQAGNSVLVTITGRVNTGVAAYSASSLSDNKGNTYTKLASVYDSTQRTGTEVWAAFSISSDSSTFTITVNNTLSSITNIHTIQADEFRNLRASAQPDQTATSNTTGPSTATTGTTGSALELVVSVASNFPNYAGSTSATVTPPSGYRSLWEQPAGSTVLHSGAADYTIATTTGVQSAAYDFSTNTGNIGVALTTLYSSLAVTGAATPTIGNLSLSSTGNPVPAGTLSQSVGTITGAGTATNLTHGAGASGFANLTIASTGTNLTHGALSKSIGNIGLSSTANELVNGTFSQPISNLTLSSTAAPVTGAVLSQSVGTLTLSTTGTSTVTGAATLPLVNLTSSSTATVSNTGTLTKTLNTLGLTATGSSPASGTLSQSVGNITFSSTGTSLSGGTLSKSIGDIGLSAAAISDFHANGVTGFANLTVLGEATNTTHGSLSKSVGNITISATGSGGISASLSKSTGDITLTTDGDAVVTGVLGASVGSIGFSGVAYRQISAESANPNFVGDITVSSTTANLVRCTLSKPIGNITFSSDGINGTNANVGVTISPITSSSAGTVSQSGVLTQTISAITATSTGSLPVIVNGINSFGSVISSSTGTVSLSGAFGQTIPNFTLTTGGTISNNAVLTKSIGDITFLGIGVGVLVTLCVLDETLPNISVSSAATNPIKSNSTIPLGNVTLSGVAANPVVGTLSTGIGSITSASTSTVSLSGMLSQTLPNLTSSSYAFSTTFADATNSIGGLTFGSTGTVGGTANLSQPVGNITGSSAGVAIISGDLQSPFGNLIIDSTVQSAMSGSFDVTIDAIVPSIVGGVSNSGALDQEIGLIAIAATTRPFALAELNLLVDNFSLIADGLQLISGYLDRPIGNIFLNARQPTSFDSRFEFPPGSGNYITYPSVEGYSPAITRIVVTPAGSFAIGVDQYIEIRDGAPKRISDLRTGDVIKTLLTEVTIPYRNLRANSLVTQQTIPSAFRVLYLKVTSVSDPGNYAVSTSITPSLANEPSPNALCSCSLVQQPDGAGCGQQFFVTVN